MASCLEEGLQHDTPGDVVEQNLKVAISTNAIGDISNGLLHYNKLWAPR